MSELRTGDEVRVFNYNRRHGPAGGESGEVVKVGRKLVTIRTGGREEVFRLDTGRINDNYGNVYFLTPEDAERRERERAGLAALREAGIEIRTGRRLTLEQIEALAEVAQTFTEREG